MPRLPGAQDVRQAPQPQGRTVSVPAPQRVTTDTSGLEALGQAGEQVRRAAVRIQDRQDATNTTMAENEFVSEANREWARRQVEDDPARPEFSTDWHSWLEEKAQEKTANVEATGTAKDEFSARLSRRVLTYRDKGFSTQLEAQRTKSKGAVETSVNRIGNDALSNPEDLPRYLDEAEDTVGRFSDTLTAEDERKAKREAVNTVVAATVQGHLDRGEINKARDVVRRATGVPGEQAGEAHRTIFSEAEREGVDPVTLAAIAKVESNFDPDAKAETSSAAGLFQFTNSTGTRFGLPSDARKASVQAQSRAAARLMAQNQEALRDGLGGEPTPGETYLAHFLGAEDAVRVLSANEDAPLSELLPERVLEANSVLRGMDAGDVSNWASEKMSEAMTGLADTGEVEGRDFGDAIPVDDVVKLHKTIDRTEDRLLKEARKQREEWMSIVAPTEARPDVDPVGVLGKQSSETAEASARMMGQIFDLEEGSTQEVERAGSQILEMQRRSGVPQGVRKLFSTDQAKQVVRRFETLEPDQAATMFLNFKNRMGEHWDRAYGELVEQGLPTGYALMGVTSDSAVDTDAVAKTLNSREEDLRSNTGTDARIEENDMLRQLETDVQEFFQVFSFGAGETQQAERMLGALRKVALDRLRKTGDPAQAREYAAALVNKRFDVLNEDNARMLVPRETGLRTGQVERALDNAQTESKLKRFSPVMMDTQRPDFLDREAVLQNAVRQGVWITNEDGTGAVLLHRFPGGGTIPVRNARGERYEVRFDDMLEMSEQRRRRSPGAPMSPPTTASGLTPEEARRRIRQRDEDAPATP